MKLETQIQSLIIQLKKEKEYDKPVQYLKLALQSINEIDKKRKRKLKSLEEESMAAKWQLDLKTGMIVYQNNKELQKLALNKIEDMIAAEEAKTKTKPEENIIID